LVCEYPVFNTASRFLHDHLTPLNNFLNASPVATQSTTSTFRGRPEPEKSSLTARLNGCSVMIAKSRSEYFLARPFAREPNAQTS
jgi:hypothetical protein